MLLLNVYCAAINLSCYYAAVMLLFKVYYAIIMLLLILKVYYAAILKQVFGLLDFWWVFGGFSGVFQGFFRGFSGVFGFFLYLKFKNKKSRKYIKEKYIYYINYFI